MKTHFLVIVTGWNCQNYVQACFDSLKAQRNQNFHAIFIDDASTNGVWHQITKISETNTSDQYRAHRNETNMGACYNRYMAITHWCADLINEDTVICFLGMDDELRPNALQLVAKQYDHTDAWMTYGNWMDQRGRMNTMTLFFDQETHDMRKYRTQRYRSTALNTFKKFLFDQMDESDFKDSNGEWFDTCTEGPYMYSALEMCGRDHIGIIADPIYMYNARLPNGTIKRQGKEYKYQKLAEMTSQPMKPQLQR